MIRQIHDTISQVFVERALDRRTCFVRVRAEPAVGNSVVVECSDRDVLDEIRRRLPDPVPGGIGVGFVELPSPEVVFTDALIAAVSVVDVRRSPSHTAELVTQVVYGDEVVPLREEGDWVLVRLEDSYIGWIRSWHLKRVSRQKFDGFCREARYRVRDNVVLIREGPGGSSLPVSDAVAGTPLLVGPSPRRGWRRVSLPDGKRGYIEARALERKPLSVRPTRGSLVTIGLRFLGIPYVWGGTTPKGFDCSGLTQRIFKLHGTVIPRDSDLQARFGRAKAVGVIEDLRPGDLLFFGKSPAQIRHVAMYLSEGLFLHASGQVRVNALLPVHPLFEERLSRDWQSTRDPLCT